MDTNCNGKLRLFVDGVITYLTQLVNAMSGDIVTNHNEHTDVYWFVRKREAMMIENKFVASLDELEYLPRLVQLGWVQEERSDPLLLLFMNERGGYGKGMPHTLPAAHATPLQSKQAAQTIFNYLTTGNFTAGLQYGVQRKMGEAVTMNTEPVYVGSEARQARTAFHLRRGASYAKPKKPVDVFADFNVSTRIKNILKNHSLYDKSWVTSCTEEYLLKFSGIGPKSIDQIKAALAEHNLKLKVKRKKK
jgi:hypothetical protein